MNKSGSSLRQDEYVSPFEAESIIDSLVVYDPLDVGSRKWEQQHEAMERLNIQAHRNVQNHSEEYVTESLILFDKVKLLIHDLICIESWKSRVFKEIMIAAAKHNSLKTYFILYHEATIVNLLEIVMYNKQACLSVGDALVDLVDYCSRKIAILNNWDHSKLQDPNTKESLLNVSEEEKLTRNFDELEFACGIHAISVMRCLTNAIADLPLSIKKRILKTTDMIVSCTHLIENAPWFQKSSRGEIQRFDGGAWVNIKRDDLPVVGRVEGQVWLTLFNLFMDAECRQMYEYSTYNYEIVLRLKPYMVDTLLDQLPPLVEVKRYLEELTIMQPPETARISSFGIEEVPELTLNVWDNTNWTNVISEHRKMFSKPVDIREIAQRYAKMYDTEDFETLLDDPKCASCGQPASQRCSRCKGEWYCGRQCQVKAWKTHKPICDLLNTAASKKDKNASTMQVSARQHVY